MRCKIRPAQIACAPPGGPDLVRGVDFSHDGQLLASASNEKTVMLWGLEMGDLQQELKHHR